MSQLYAVRLGAAAAPAGTWELEVGEATLAPLPGATVVGGDPRSRTPDWVMDPSLVIGQWQVAAGQPACSGCTFVVTKGTDPVAKFGHFGPGTFTPGRIGENGVFVPQSPRRWPLWLGAAALLGGAAWLLMRRA